MKRLIYISILSIFFISCKKKIYHSFSEEEEALLVYDQGDAFKLKNEDTGEVIELTVTEKYIRYKDDSGPKLGPSRKEHFMEEGELKFSSSDGNYNGRIYIYKDKIDQFTITPRLNTLTYAYSGDGTLGNKISIVVNGISYSDVYKFNSIYLSLTHGFVKLDNSTDLYTIVP